MTTRWQVALVSRAEGPEARRALDAAAAAAVRAGATLRVIRAGTPLPLPGEFVGGQIHSLPVESTQQQLRAVALADGQADWVALTEDSAVVAPDWVVRLAQAVQPGIDVIGGVVEPPITGRLRDLGAYWAEYGWYGRHRRRTLAGAPPITMSSVAYRTAILGRVASWTTQGHWEDSVHSLLADLGHQFVVCGRAVVRHQERIEVSAFVRDRWRHGRDYTRRRLAGHPWHGRHLHALVTPILPLLLLARLASRTGRADRPGFIAAAPWTLLFLAAWAAGEAAGALRGDHR